MKARALLLALLAANGRASTAYVTDELVVGVYAEKTTQGQRLTTLHSGAGVETLAASGESTQVRLPDGRTGWVKSVYLTNREPATLRLKQLEDELDRARATPPALAEAAARNEVERLTRELAAVRAQAQAAPPGPDATAAQPPATPPATPGALHASHADDSLAAVGPMPAAHIGLWIAGLGLALGAGFWLGYATLARRIKEKFGGIKVY